MFNKLNKIIHPSGYSYARSKVDYLIQKIKSVKINVNHLLNDT
jgi:hypothetical protein